ncbi:UL11 myristylated tegument protein [Meleagrid alphaherpesvirus 1]|uniref:UL11 myristylated tegument protein n=1 Tax=Meleagrid herpesvirus 1 TaxID=37108 RepID=Q9DPS3_MEHV1|nr:myristylated tegument protein [Meleagrid alphaherpesvirus 1]AAG45748.1 UL11 myristylated tegument protein [Meleagrid alphaherpesvirus 1]
MGQATSYLTDTFRRCCKRNILLTKSGQTIAIDRENYDSFNLDELRYTDYVEEAKIALLDRPIGIGKRINKNERDYTNHPIL